MIFLDSETCGLTGPMVLLQYAEDDGEVILHEVWNEPIGKTLRLLEYIADKEVCVFNLVFDWFHVNKLYNILRVLYDAGYSGIPSVSAIAQIEADNPSHWCLKPRKSLDLMLYARRQEVGQMAMRRKPIYIRNIPAEAAEKLSQDLINRIQLPEICFAKKAYKWRIQETEDPDLVNLVLDFHGSTKLAHLANVLLGEDKADWPIPRDMLPTEVSWKPYGEHGKLPWTVVISRHIAMWQANEKARYYAWRDVDLLRKLYRHFGNPPAGDNDSELAAAMGATRWRGFALDHDHLGRLAEIYKQNFEMAPYCSSPQVIKKLLLPMLPEAQRAFIKSTDKDTLASLANTSTDGAVQNFCKSVLEARQGRTRLGICERLLSIERFHPEFKISGTKSNRMAGGGEDKASESINPQGIPRSLIFRKSFPLAGPGEELWGGDADEFEVRIVDAVWHCPKIREQLISGKKFHAIMGEIWYRTNYEKILESKGTDNNLYDPSKGADFGFFYGAQPYKLSKVLGLDEEDVEESFDNLKRQYPELYEARDYIAMKFCSMRQPGGIGTKVEWHEPASYSESLFGFRRYFTVENSICKGLYNFADSLPRSYKELPGYVVRRTERGRQTIGGAIQSALFAAAFSTQASNMRAGCNHEIQSPGAEITKGCQRALWDLQPVGTHEWYINTFQVHDELWSVQKPGLDTKGVMENIINEYKEKVPLLSWGWEKCESWGDK